MSQDRFNILTGERAAPRYNYDILYHMIDARTTNDGGRNYACGFTAGFNAAPISVTPVNRQKVSVGDETFFRTRNMATERMYNSPWLLYNDKGKQITLTTATKNIFNDPDDPFVGHKYVTVKGVNPCTNRNVTHRYLVQRSTENTGGNIYKPFG